MNQCCLSPCWDLIPCLRMWVRSAIFCLRLWLMRSVYRWLACALSKHLWNRHFEIRKNVLENLCFPDFPLLFVPSLASELLAETVVPFSCNENRHTFSYKAKWLSWTRDQMEEFLYCILIYQLLGASYLRLFCPNPRGRYTKARLFRTKDGVITRSVM